MSLRTKTILSGKIDNASLVDFPAYLMTDSDKSYKLSVRGEYTPLILEFDFSKIDCEYVLDLPILLNKKFSYDFYIDWGDRSQITYIKSYTELPNKKHTYKCPGIYLVLIYGNFHGINNSQYILEKKSNPFENLTKILSWRK